MTEPPQPNPAVNRHNGVTQLSPRLGVGISVGHAVMLVGETGEFNGSYWNPISG